MNLSLCSGWKLSQSWAPRKWESFTHRAKQRPDKPARATSPSAAFFCISHFLRSFLHQCAHSLSQSRPAEPQGTAKTLMQAPAPRGAETSRCYGSIPTPQQWNDSLSCTWGACSSPSPTIILHPTNAATLTGPEGQPSPLAAGQS